MIRLMAALVLPCHSAPLVRVEAVRAAPALAAPASAAGALAAPAAKPGGIPGFIYPEQMEGTPMKADIPWKAWGVGVHEGHVSVFNLARKTAESLLPKQFGLAETGEAEHPVVVVWGEISNASANWRGIPLPSSLRYREWQLYVPGVHRKDRPSELRTYVPRIFVDAYLPEALGRKFFYKKIQLERMSFDERRLRASGAVTMEVKSVDGPARTWPEMKQASREWRALLDWLPGTDIMGEAGMSEPPRYSAFAWGPKTNEPSPIRLSQVEMRLQNLALPGVDLEALRKPIRSIASFAVENWRFWVNNDFLEGPDY